MQDFSGEQVSGVGAFIWETLDGAALGFGNEVLCGGAIGGVEGISSFWYGKDYDWDSVSKDTSHCTDYLNAEHEKQRILYEDATNAGFWASFLVPGIPVAKVLKGGKGVKLAQRSRHVAPANYGTGCLK